MWVGLTPASNGRGIHPHTERERARERERERELYTIKRGLKVRIEAWKEEERERKKKERARAHARARECMFRASFDTLPHAREDLRSLFVRLLLAINKCLGSRGKGERKTSNFRAA